MESFIDDLCVEYDLRGSGLNGYIYFYLNKDAKDLIKETSIFKKNYSSVIYSSIDIGEEKDIEINQNKCFKLNVLLNHEK